VIALTAPITGATVGVCEDDEQLREILRLALEREGMTVRVTGTGHEAVQAFPALSLQAIVLDSGLPDADGRDTVWPCGPGALVRLTRRANRGRARR